MDDIDPDYEAMHADLSRLPPDRPYSDEELEDQFRAWRARLEAQYKLIDDYWLAAGEPIPKAPF